MLLNNNGLYEKVEGKKMIHVVQDDPKAQTQAL